MAKNSFVAEETFKNIPFILNHLYIALEKFQIIAYQLNKRREGFIKNVRNKPEI